MTISQSARIKDSVIAEGAIIHAFSHLERAYVGKSAQVGPFARLREGSRLEADVKVGNFVETKKSTLERGAKVSHLSYIGDATIGEKANVGAGTITCNYDGYFKYQTHVGAGAFVGSNTSLVAPANVGNGAFVAAGSTVTETVPDDALYLNRASSTVKTGWAASYHARQKAKKSSLK